MEYRIYKCDQCENEVRIKMYGESFPDGWADIQIKLRKGNYIKQERAYLLCPDHANKAGFARKDINESGYDETLADKLFNIIQEIVLENPIS